MRKMLYKLMILPAVLFIASFYWVPAVWAESDAEGQHGEAHDHDGDAPEPDSVWGAMKYTGYHIKEGSKTTGHAIKKGSIKAGDGIKKGGKTMGKGFKKAGGEIKEFFVGD